MRNRINEALKTAVKAKDQIRVSTLRLINAAIKDRDIAIRSDDRTEGVTEEEIFEVMSKMIKQRNESAKLYEEGSRLELAERERAEIVVIEEFLPKQMDEEEITTAVDAAVAEIGASGLKDMGRVMGVLKQNYAGKMDFGKASAKVKAALS